MGEVWRGTHLGQDLPVAIKVLTSDETRSDRWREAFRNEVRNAARLYHPGVALVFDHGLIPESVARDSGGRLRAGSPWLVMELATGGTLVQVERPMAWRPLRRILLRLLDALAHAHARGVVHRDLKPANVLLCTHHDARPGPKVTDFGIAHPITGLSRGGVIEDEIAGSPHYMAPEQLLGYWRDYGPWTDLYALGCIACELATGAVPFAGRTVREIIDAHLHTAVPRIVARGEGIPSGFAAWVTRLLHKDPADRFGSAAEAAEALLACNRGRRVGDTSPAGFDAVVAGSSDIGALATTMHVGHVSDHEGTQASARVTVRATSSSGVPIPLAIHGVDLDPEAWQLIEVDPLPAALRGAGLGLYGLRPIPFVGRRRERSVLWDVLEGVRSSGETRVVVLHGPAGVGKSRIAEWFVERADETGAASHLRAVHGAPPTPGDGLGPMFERAFGCAGLTRVEVAARVKRRLEVEGNPGLPEVAAITELIRPLSIADESGPSLRFSNARERHVVAWRVLTRMSRRRPVIVWIDDVQWGLDAIEFVRFAIDRAREEAAPVLFVLTMRDESLASEPVAAERLEAVCQETVTLDLAVGPLDDTEQVRLVRELVGVDPELAGQVAARTRGNPLFAVQLVGDWVQREWLEVHDQGLRLREGIEPSLPDDVHEAWRGRVERITAAFGPQAGPALELAAALGQEVVDDEWRDACAFAELHAPNGLVDQLIETRLALPRPDGWAFAHGMIRESLERVAREAGRWTRHAAACAVMLERRYPQGTPGLAERHGRALLEAGLPHQALASLHEGAREREAASDIVAAEVLLVLREKALEGIGSAPDDARWVSNALDLAELAGTQGRFDDATRRAERALGIARRNQWAHLEARALERLGYVARQRSDLSTAGARFEQARQIFVDLGDVAGQARVLRGLGWVAVLAGRLSEAESCVEAARQRFESLNDERGVAGCERTLGDVARNRGDFELAARWFRRAGDRFERLGNIAGVSECVHGVAEVQRYQGALREAAEGYRRSIELERIFGTRAPTIPLLNLGLVAIARERWAEARDSLEHVVSAFRRLRQPGYLGCAHACLLPAVAGLGDWDAWDEHFALALEAFEEAPLVDVDIATAAETAARLAAAAGKHRRARRAWGLAFEQWTSLGQTSRADVVAGALEQLHAQDGD